MAEIVRPALVQQVAIGTLYDARVDQFLQSSILLPNLPRGIALRGILPPSDELQNWMAEGSDHASRFRAIRVNDNLAVSILSGSIDLEGSANFLKDSTVDGNTLFGAVRHFFNTYKDVLDINSGDFRTEGVPAMFLPPDPRSTHVVTSVKWGLQSILTMKHRIADPSQQVTMKLSFQRDLMELNAIVNSIYSLDFSDDLASQRLELDYEFKLYTDIQRDRGIGKETLPVMCRFVQLGPQQITHTPDEAGYPMEYTLHPTQVLRHLMPGGGPHQALRAITNIDPFFTLLMIGMLVQRSLKSKDTRSWVGNNILQGVTSSRVPTCGSRIICPADLYVSWSAKRQTQIHRAMSQQWSDIYRFQWRLHQRTHSVSRSSSISLPFQ